jgi:predicted kinase
MTPYIIVLVGCPGSGKSTFSKTFIENNQNDNIVYINQDSQGREHLEIFYDAVKNKSNIIVDRMNFNKIQRDRYLDPAKKQGYTTHIVVIHENKATCLKRCEERKQHPTITTKEHREQAINMFFQKYERPLKNEADIVEYLYPENKENTTCIIVDIDNTLSDATHREHYLEGPKKNWTAFFNEMNKDPLNKWCRDIMHAFLYGRSTISLVLCSGRPDTYKQVTKDWLEENKVFYDYLFMRQGNDSRADNIIKEVILDFEILTRFKEVLFCIDDRMQVINMYRERGLTVLDCKGNTF